MDILIPNLELPLEERIELSIYPNGLVVNHSTLDANNKRKAVALSSHGRLIDADALIEKTRMWSLVRGDEYFELRINNAIVKEILEDAQTIVGATE